MISAGGVIRDIAPEEEVPLALSGISAPEVAIGDQTLREFALTLHGNVVARLSSGQGA